MTRHRTATASVQHRRDEFKTGGRGRTYQVATTVWSTVQTVELFGVLIRGDQMSLFDKCKLDPPGVVPGAAETPSAKKRSAALAAA